jgi:D-alanine-D-alanine ligase-like ATP-grasp enzyme
MSNALLRLGKFGLDSHLVEREVLARGHCTLRFSPVAFAAGPSQARASELGFYYSASNLTSKVGREIAGDQQRTRIVLTDAGVAVPLGETFSRGRAKQARRYAGRIGYPVVVKPARGRLANGVATDLRSDESVEAAIAGLPPEGDGDGSFVVEQHISGSTFRVLVVRNQAVSVLRRIPATVVGDGVQTLAQLVAAKNKEREQHPYFRTRPIELDDTVADRLVAAKLRADSVIAAGRSVELRGPAQASVDGDVEDVTAETHPDLLAVAQAAVRALPGVPHAGVDIVAMDHRDVSPQQPAVVVDIDVMPHLAPHEMPSQGEGRPVSGLLVDAHVRSATSPIARLDVTMTSSPRPKSLREKVAKLAADLGVSAEVSVVDSVNGNVAATLRGPLADMSVVTALAAVGNRAPEMIETVPREVSA